MKKLERVRNLTIVLFIGLLLVASAVVPLLMDSHPVEAGNIYISQVLFGGHMGGVAADDDRVQVANVYYAYPLGASNDAASSGWDVTETNREFVIPCSGTIRHLKVYIVTTPTQGHWDFTFRLNGADTALTVQIDPGDTTGEDTTHNFDVVAGDRISLEADPLSGLLGVDLPTFVYWSWGFSPATSGNSILLGKGSVRAGTRWAEIGITSAELTAASQTRSSISCAGQLTKMCVYTEAGVAFGAGETATITLIQNDVATTTEVVMTEGETFDYTESATAVNAGDIVYVQTVGNVIKAVCISFVFDPDTDLEYPVFTARAVNMDTGNPKYLSPLANNNNAPDSTESKRQVMSLDANLKGFYVRLSGSPDNGAGTQSYTYQYRDDNANISGASVTISEASTTGSVSVDVDIDEWSLLSLSCTPSGTPTQRSAYICSTFQQTYLTDTYAIQDFIATPISSTEIRLNWYDPNNPTSSPDINIVIQRKTGGYPNSPPAADSTQVYNQQTINGNCELIDSGLNPGTTYYYRIWRHDTETGAYILDDQDWATTYAGGGGGGDIDEPTEWNQAPTCDIFNNWFIGTPMNETADAMGMPRETLCLISALLLIGLISSASYPPAALSGMPRARTIAIPLFTMCVLIVVAAIAGVIPLYILALAVASGVIAVFLWTRV